MICEPNIRPHIYRQIIHISKTNMQFHWILRLKSLRIRFFWGASTNKIHLHPWIISKSVTSIKITFNHNLASRRSSLEAYPIKPLFKYLKHYLKQKWIVDSHNTLFLIEPRGLSCCLKIMWGITAILVQLLAVARVLLKTITH
jgi:hypothetical protein